MEGTNVTFTVQLCVFQGYIRIFLSDLEIFQGSVTLNHNSNW